MKRSAEMLGVLFVFAVFCPFSAGAITSGDAYQAQNGDNSFQWAGEVEGQPLTYSYNYSYENGEGHAFKWEGAVEDQPLEYCYSYNYKNGNETSTVSEALSSDNAYASKNGEDHGFKWSGELEDMPLTYYYNHAYAYGVSEEGLLGEMTQQMEFSYAFSNQGSEQGPFELMNMASVCQPEDSPVENCCSLDGDVRPVPEPSTVLLLSLGGSVLFSRRKR